MYLTIKYLLSLFHSRSRSSWIKLFGFYGLLWTFVTSFWFIYYAIFQSFMINDREPTLKLGHSTIGTIPGLAIRPRPNYSSIKSSLIHFKSSSTGDWQYWVDNLNEYLKPYQELESGTGQHAQGDCSLYSERDPHKFCPFDPRIIPNECSEAQNYSYHLGKPCILLKLNRIWGWLPDPYISRPDNYPTNAPFKEGQIQISCEGRSNLDKEHLGPIDYHPQGIEAKYFPFTNQPGYKSPFVMVQFKNPKPGVAIFVECKAWAKNIVHDRESSKGVASFELMID